MHLFAFLKELFSGPAASAICWTLVHSLWQGLLFAIITGIIMLATKESRPALRYKIVSIQFLLFIIVPVITFIYEWNKGVVLNGFADGGTQKVGAAATNSTVVFEDSGFGYHLLDTISGFLSAYTSLIVAAWFMVLLVKSIKIVSFLFYTEHLRNTKTHAPSEYWKGRMEVLCSKLQVTKAVQLLESEIIKIPAVIGHFKPVIFIPLGILAGLPAEQVEAVLLHELAHIRRNDYFFNLIQNIVETIFFFNPALLWIASIIREERENCCDDIAIEQTKDKRQFIESLIRFRELYIVNNSNYVTAFAGNRNSFVNRITRIAMNKNKSLNPTENIFLVVSLIIISTLVMAFCKSKQPAPPAPVPEIIKMQAAQMIPPAAFTDTVPKSKKSNDRSLSTTQLDNGDYTVIYSDIDKSAGKETIVLKADGNEYKIVKLNGEIAYLVVNDEKVPKEKLADYSELIKKINTRLERMKEEQAIRDKEQEERNKEQVIRNKEQEQRNAEQLIRNKEQEQRNQEQIIRNKQQDQQNEQQKTRDAEQTIRNKEQEHRNAEQVIRNKQQDQQNEEEKIRDAEQVSRNKEQEQRNAEQVIRNKEQEQRNAEQVIRNKEQAERNEELKNLINDLIIDKIITGKKNLNSFSLTDDEFIINGTKQSAEVLKKYKTRYPKLVGGTYNYRYN